MSGDVFAIDGVDALFDGSIAEFVSKRDALVTSLKAEKRKEDAAAVKALRKPSAAAWAVNQVARHHADELAKLFASADALRDAQAKAMQGRDDGSLRTTTRDWRAKVNALASAAGTQHRDDAMAAFEAASVDDAIGAIVRLGRLTALPEAAGFGALAGMPDPPTPSSSRSSSTMPAPGDDDPVALDEFAPLDEPVTQTEPDTSQSRDELAREREIADAEKELERLTHRLRRAEQKLDQAKQAVRDAEDARDEAAKRLRALKD